MFERIKIEQALFGYRDGHNLMAASVPLAPRVRQFLATITDSSGPENTIGFEVAFTGLTVPDTDFYALFCTWPAPEMTRPGCVWSHVILIGLADLARIPDLTLLRKFCTRPSLPLKMSDYEQPITLDVSGSTKDRAEAPDSIRAVHLLRALYEHPEDGVVILDEESASWELPIFSLWSQQWPRLRREFAFSTGSLGDRRLAGVAFDLQVAPLSSERLWRRSEVPTLVLNYSTPPPNLFTALPAPWVDTALKDLQAGSPNGLRQFLFDYGSDTEKPRVAFAKLASAHEIVHDPQAGLAKLLCSVGEFFPSQAQAVQLKRSLIALPKTFSSVERLERAWTIVSFLLSAPEATAYACVDFEFAGLVFPLWKEKRDEIIMLLSHLVRQEESPAASSFAKAIAKVVDSAALRYIADRHAELIPMIISHCPALAFDVDTWHLPGHVQSQVYEALSRLSLSQEDWAKIVGAMFIAATYVSVREAVGKAGSCAMKGAFRWLELPIAEQLLPSQPWREALVAPATEILNCDNKLSPAQLALSAWCVPSDIVRHTLSSSREDIQNLAEQPLEALPLPLRVPTAFLLATLGLRSKTNTGVKLIVKSFYPVHNSLASGEYSSELWSLLSPELPSLGWWRDWDRCEKLRRAVNSWLTKYVMVGNPLLEAAKTPEQRKLARQLADSKNESDDFLD